MNAAEESLIAYRKHDAARAAEKRYDVGIVLSAAAGFGSIFFFLQYWDTILLGLLMAFCFVQSIRTNGRVKELATELPANHRKVEYQIQDLYAEVMRPMAEVITQAERAAVLAYREPVFVDVYNPPKAVAQPKKRETYDNDNDCWINDHRSLLYSMKKYRKYC